MDKMTVAELAKECSVKDQVILAEAKRLGLYIFSSAATIDASFAETIRKKILSQKEADAAKKAAAVEKKTKKATATDLTSKKASAPTPRIRKQSKKSVETKDAEVSEDTPLETASAQPPQEEAVGKQPKKPAFRVVKKKKEEPLVEPLPVETSEVEAEDSVPTESMPMVSGAETPVEETTVKTKPEPSVPAPLPDQVDAPVPTQSEASTGEVKSAEPPVPQKTDVTGGSGKKQTILAPKKKTATVLKQTNTVAVIPTVPPRVYNDITKTVPLRPGFRSAGFSKPQFIRKKQQHGKPEPIRPRIELPRPPDNPEDFKPIDITEGVTIKELAEKMDIRSKFIIQKLLSKGILASINQALDVEAAKNVCAEFGFRASVISFEQEAESKQETPDKPEDYVIRPPVVTIMGHVDHGKTSLLDAIRETNIMATEAGGITQHIGAYQVEIPVEGRERSIVFLDTPGHEAFTMMRARGAQATDIVVLVVAADDGVMPQTIEAIHHSKAANVPIIVAINKIDKPGAQIDRVKQALADQGLLAEDWGGETVTVEVSAKQRLNLDLLLEMIVLVADMRDIKANPKRLSSGVVLEAKVDRGRGNIATVLVQNGTLRQGDAFVAGSVHGRVRALVNDRGRTIEFAGPSIPVEITGLQDLPMAGDMFQVFDDANKARQVAEFRRAKEREASLQKTSRLSLQALYDQMREGVVKELPLIVKADVQGSVEVVVEMLNKLSTEKVKVKILHNGAGAITETDVLLASASNAIVIGFNVRPERKAQDLADSEGVEIRLYTVIYNLTNEITAAMIGILEKTIQEKYVGRAEVRDTFRVPKFGVIAGCHVQDGLIKRNSEARLLRDNAVIHEGKISSLRRFKEDASEVKSGFECGIGFERFSDIKVGDVIEAYVIEKVQPTSL